MYRKGGRGEGGEEGDVCAVPTLTKASVPVMHSTRTQPVEVRRGRDGGEGLCSSNAIQGLDASAAYNLNSNGVLMNQDRLVRSPS